MSDRFLIFSLTAYVQWSIECTKVLFISENSSKMTLTNGDTNPQASTEVRFSIGDGDNSPPPSTPVGDLAEAEDQFPINEMNGGFHYVGSFNGDLHNGGSSGNLLQPVNGMGINEKRKRLK